MAGRAKLLVLMTSPLDQIAHGLRAVEAFRRQRPELEVTWVGRDFYAPLIEAFDCVDRVIAFPRAGGFRRLWRFARELRGERFHYVFDFEGHARTGLMSLLARGERVVGRRTAREGATICYRELAPTPTGSGSHALEEMLAFASVFGCPATLSGRLPLRRRPSLPAVWQSARRSGGPCVCLFPARFKRERAWPGMVALGVSLRERLPSAQVFLMGVGPTADPGALPAGVVDLQGELDWPQICAALEEADLVVANDNGPAQLAGALGRPNLTLFSLVLPERRGSYPLQDPSNRALRAPNGQVERIGLETVLAEAEKLLAR